MRQQLYRFAHQRLMTEVHGNPSSWWNRLKAEGAEPLRSLYESCAEGLEAEDKAPFDGTEVEYTTEVPGVEAILISPPKPQSATECHTIALVRKPGAAASKTRYFVMEKGLDADDGSARAFWAEWRSGPGGTTMRIRGQDVSPIDNKTFLTDIAPELQMDVGPAPDFPGPAASSNTSSSNKSSGASKVLKIGCGLIALMFFGCCGFAGYLAYLEEGQDLGAPGEEIERIKVKADKPFEFEFVWDGTGYAFNDIWLDVEGKKDTEGFAITGKMGCTRFGDPDLREFRVNLGNKFDVHRLEETGSKGFKAWLKVHDEYTHSGPTPLKCQGVLRAASGKIKKADLVVTRIQRPSDWSAF